VIGYLNLWPENLMPLNCFVSMIEANLIQLQELAGLNNLFVLKQTHSRSLKLKNPKSMQDKYDCNSGHKGRLVIPERPFRGLHDYQTVYTSGLCVILRSQLRTRPLPVKKWKDDVWGYQVLSVDCPFLSFFLWFLRPNLITGLRVVPSRNWKTWNPEPRTWPGFESKVCSKPNPENFCDDVTKSSHLYQVPGKSSHFWKYLKNFSETWQRYIEPGMWRFVTKMWRHIFFFLGFRRPNLITGLSGWRASD